jgi:hypothetical protein
MTGTKYIVMLPNISRVCPVKKLLKNMSFDSTHTHPYSNYYSITNLSKVFVMNSLELVMGL